MRRIPTKTILALALSTGPDECPGLYALFADVQAPPATPVPSGLVIRHPDGQRTAYSRGAGSQARTTLIAKILSILHP